MQIKVIEHNRFQVSTKAILCYISVLELNFFFLRFILEWENEQMWGRSRIGSQKLSRLPVELRIWCRVWSQETEIMTWVETKSRTLTDCDTGPWNKFYLKKNFQFLLWQLKMKTVFINIYLLCYETCWIFCMHPWYSLLFKKKKSSSIWKEGQWKFLSSFQKRYWFFFFFFPQFPTTPNYLRQI